MLWAVLRFLWCGSTHTHARGLSLSLCVGSFSRVELRRFSRHLFPPPFFYLLPCCADLNRPDAIPRELQHTFDFVCCDPPFLNGEAVQSVLHTASLLARTPSTPVLLLTGAALEQAILDMTGGALQRQPFEPRHQVGEGHSRLQNDFASYANFPLQCCPSHRC